MDTPDNVIPFPQTAAQVNQPQTGQVILNADQARSQLVDLFEQFKPQLQAYQKYAEKAAALAIEFHRARLAEVFASAQVEELTLAATLDARETPKSLDTALAQLANVPVKRIVFDRINSKFLLFV